MEFLPITLPHLYFSQTIRSFRFRQVVSALFIQWPPLDSVFRINRRRRRSIRLCIAFIGAALFDDVPASDGTVGNWRKYLHHEATNLDIVRDIVYAYLN